MQLRLNLRWASRVSGALIALAMTSAPAWSMRGPVPGNIEADDANNARVIVKFKADSTLMRAQAARKAQRPEHASALSQRLGMALNDGLAIDSRTQVMQAAGMSSAALAATLSADSDVEFAVVDQRRYIAAAPNDPLYPDGQSGTPVVGQWYLRAPSNSLAAGIDAEAAWAITPGSSNVTVAVLDSGVRLDHPDLAGKLYDGYDFVSDKHFANDGDGRDADPSDPGDAYGGSVSSWHGTQTAGLIGAATDNGIGMASIGRNVMLLPVRVLGVGTAGFDSDILAGMRWAAGLSVPGVPTNTHPAKIINLSLGKAGSCPSTYASVLAELTAAGVVVVAAAGNNALAVRAPANCAGVVAVGAVSHAGAKADYSSLGPEVTLSAPGGDCVNETVPCLYPMLSTSNSGVTIPRHNIYTNGDNRSIGTSFAAPLVAGTLGLMFSANGALTPAQAIDALRSSARAFPTSGAPAGAIACHAPSSVEQSSECYCTTSTCGAGLLDAGRAVAAAASLVSVTPEIAYSPGTAVAGSAITLDSSASVAPNWRTIVSHQWELTEGTDIATFTSATNAATATLMPTAAGTLTVRLTLVDSTGAQVSKSQQIVVAAAPGAPPTEAPKAAGDGGGGGGAVGGGVWLGLALAIGLLERSRRRASASARRSHR